MGDISNRLVLRLIDRTGKQNETPDHRPMRLVSRLVFFSSRPASRRYRWNPRRLIRAFLIVWSCEVCLAACAEMNDAILE